LAWISRHITSTCQRKLESKITSCDLTRDIAYSIERAKTYRPWEVEYMHWNEIMSLVEQDARAEARAEAQAETRFEDIDRFVADGFYDAARACEILGVDIAAYNEYLAEKNKK